MPRNYVSDELLHWTGRGRSTEDAFQALSSICEERILRLTYCPNYVSSEYNPQTAMVCFTDIPLKHSKEQCSKFGSFGVGFKKENLIKYGANPALYTTGVHFNRIKKLAALLSRMEDLEKDREWRNELEPYQFGEEETLALQDVTDFLQEYSYKNNDTSDYVTYYQREWRLTFRSLMFSGGSKPHSPGTTSFYIRNETRFSIFKFDVKDVAFIVVPFKYWWRARKIAKKMGCKLKIYEFNVSIWAK